MLHHSIVGPSAGLAAGLMGEESRRRRPTPSRQPPRSRIDGLDAPFGLWWPQCARKGGDNAPRGECSVCACVLGSGRLASVWKTREGPRRLVVGCLRCLCVSNPVGVILTDPPPLGGEIPIDPAGPMTGFEWHLESDRWVRSRARLKLSRIDRSIKDAITRAESDESQASTHVNQGTGTHL